MAYSYTKSVSIIPLNVNKVRVLDIDSLPRDGLMYCFKDAKLYSNIFLFSAHSEIVIITQSHVNHLSVSVNDTLYSLNNVKMMSESGRFYSVFHGSISTTSVNSLWFSVHNIPSDLRADETEAPSELCAKFEVTISRNS